MSAPIVENSELSERLIDPDWNQSIFRPLKQRLLLPLASLKLTVALLGLSILLIFFGTLAQVDYGIWTILTKYFRTWFVWVDLQIFFPRSWDVIGKFPFPGGYVLGGGLLVNLIAAHVLRFRVSWKRTGILLIHAGLIIMLLSELGTAIWAVEGQMRILEGQAANYVEDIRTSELAVVRPIDEYTQDVVVVPASLIQKALKSEESISHPDLPFDIKPLEYMTNSNLESPTEANRDNPANSGIGTETVAEKVPEVSGTSADQRVDVPSAYLDFLKKGAKEKIGTYLISGWLIKPEQVAVGEKTYQVSLRFKRTYKPYTVQLIDFRHEKYIGTEKPKNFSSIVNLVDEDRDVLRDVDIYMNHPLRYAGETFYQSEFLPGDTGTILQVVRNPVWTLPYISCGMVSLGMLFHFGLSLWSFLRRSL